MADSNTTCCPPNSWGKVIETPLDQETETLGSVLSLGAGKVDTYVVGPQDTVASKALIVITDVYGFSTRLKLLCDQYASDGFLVLMPGILRGQTAIDNPHSDFVSWMKTYDFENVVRPDVEACIAYAQQNTESSSAIMSLGFCWGGWVIMKAIEAGMPISRVAVPHPSFQIESMVFGGDEVPIMVKVANMATWQILPSKSEAPVCQPGGKIAKAIEANNGSVIPFQSMEHGWVSRGDFTDSAVKDCGDEALKSIQRFFAGAKN